MSKLVVISLGQRDLGTGFPSVRAQIWSSDNIKPINVIGRLPQDTTLHKLYERWRKLYEVFYQGKGLRRGGIIEIEEDDITNFSEVEFQILCQSFQSNINEWLKSREFQRIDQQIRAYLQPTEDIQVVIETEDSLLQRIPWQHWQFFSDFRQAELALSPPEYQTSPLEKHRIPRANIRILAVLGNSTGINITEDRHILGNLPDNAETVFLVEPTREELDRYLWDEMGWDILFFAGHSQTDGKTGTIEINPLTRLVISDLSNALRKAIERGLHLAIFNSCDGLGIAQYLADLYIPQLIVMREPVPDKVAQEFLKHFLGGYAGGKSLYGAVREAREKLQGLEDSFPCASWLPVIYQNPTVTPKTWQELRIEKEEQANLPSSPYQGLFAFQEEDAPLFFGRETFTEQLVEAVHNKSVIGVIGASGSGKSSVVFAGLIPKLREEGHWKIVTLRTGDRPFHALATAMVPALEPDLGRSDRILKIRQLESAFKQEQWILRDLIKDFIEQNPTTCFLVVIDQFEEIYTLCADAEERQIFLDRLLETANHTLNFTVVLTLRADFLTQALSSRPFADALQKGDIKLGPMTRLELESAIVKPAEHFGVQFERGLARRILDEIEHESGSLPLLEFALTQLWEQRKDALITHEAYNEIGGVKAALARYANEVYQQLSDEDQRRSETIFIQLVRPGEGTEDTRKVASRADIGDPNWDLVKRLADARLIVTGRIERIVTELETETLRVEAEETVEVIHEALIREWLQLREWMNNNRDFRLWQDRLRVAREQWQASIKDKDLLLRGAALATAEDWLAKRLSELNAFDKEYIRAGLQLRKTEKTEQEQKQAEKIQLRRKANFRLRIGLGISLGFAVLAGFFGLAANDQKQQAKISEINSKISEINSFKISSEMLFLKQKKFDALIESLRAAFLIRQGIKVDDETKTQVALNLQQAIYGVKERNHIEAHKNPVTKVRFSPDGQMMVSASVDGTIKLWKRNGSLITSLTGHEGKVGDVGFSPDGTKIASVGGDGTLRLWDLSGKELAKWSEKEQFSGIGANIAGQGSSNKSTPLINGLIDNSPAQKAGLRIGDQIITVNGKSTQDISEIKILEVIHNDIRGKIGTQVKLTILRGDNEKIDVLITRESIKNAISLSSLSFSYDGTKIATAGESKEVNIRDLQNGNIIATLQGHQSSVSGVSFSPDGKLVATGSKDGKLRLWKSDGTPVKIPKSEKEYIDEANVESPVTAVSFSPNGGQIITADESGHLTLWYRNGNLAKKIGHHDKIVYDIAFSPDSLSVLSVSGDNLIALWDIDVNQENTLIDSFQGHETVVSSISFSPDGKSFASAGHDGIIKLWSLQSSLLNKINNGNYGVSEVVFSPDGKTITSIGDDNNIKFWHPDGTPKDKAWDDKQPHWRIKYSPDGQLIATIGFDKDSNSIDKKVKIFNLDGSLKAELIGHGQSIYDFSFSPDGQMIATASKDRTARLWKLDGSQIKILEDNRQETNGLPLLTIAFNPDPKNPIVATASGKLVKLWTIENKLLNTLKQHQDNVIKISFSPDGKIIATASVDKTVNLWELDGGTLKYTLQGHIDSVTDVKFSPNSKLIATASNDKKIKLWNSVTGKLLGTLQGHNKSVLSINFSPDEKTLLSASGDGKIIFWNLDLDLDNLFVSACYLAKDYLANDSSLQSGVKGICNGVEEDWQSKGVELSQSGDVEEAIKFFKKAKEKNPDLLFDPDKKSRQIAAPALIQKGKVLVIKGQVQEAINSYRKAQEIDSNFFVTASDLNSLCWIGTKHSYKDKQLMQELLKACDKAVNLDPENGNIRDSRGLARLSIADKQGAIDDFQAYVNWWDKLREFGKENTKNYMQRSSQRRQRLIKTLKTGKNVDPDYELEFLWTEE